jgi:hypothetical protein
MFAEIIFYIGTVFVLTRMLPILKCCTKTLSAIALLLFIPWIQPMTTLSLNSKYLDPYDIDLIFRW